MFDKGIKAIMYSISCKVELESRHYLLLDKGTLLEGLEAGKPVSN